MITQRRYFVLISLAVLCLILGRFCLPSVGASDANTAKAATTPQSRVYVPYPYIYHDNSYDIYSHAIDQYQKAIDQRLNGLQKDVLVIDGDLRVLFENHQKQEASVEQVLKKLDRIERNLGNVSGRLKKLEERIEIQEVRIRKLKREIPSDANAPEPNGPAVGIY